MGVMDGEPAAKSIKLRLRADTLLKSPVNENILEVQQVSDFDWSFNLNLCGEKITEANVYMCELCDLPILMFGRITPCKHFFCHTCALKCQDRKECHRCQSDIDSVDKCAMGTLHICLFDGEKYDNNGCRRAYLSERDLQAHIQIRHPQATTLAPSTPVSRPPAAMSQAPMFYQPPPVMAYGGAQPRGITPQLQVPHMQYAQQPPPGQFPQQVAYPPGYPATQYGAPGPHQHQMPPYSVANPQMLQGAIVTQSYQAYTQPPPRPFMQQQPPR